MSHDTTGNMDVEAQICRRLWVAVACAAITDAAAEVAKARIGDKRYLAIAQAMYYFRGRDWREVCEMAGMTIRPDHVERFLRSDLIAQNSSSIKANIERAFVDRALARTNSQRGAA